jgi:MscS family membrane protein
MSLVRVCVALAVSLTVVLVSPRGFAADAGQDKAVADKAEADKAREEAEDAPSPESPRVSLQAYLDAARAGRYEEAGKYLDTSRTRDADPARLARRLKAVLDRYVWFDLDKISGKPEGTVDDQLPRDAEDVAHIPIKTGLRSPVRMVRDRASSRWEFSRATVSNIDAWYEELEDRWLIERLPQALLRPGPRDILWWQWLALPLLLLVSALFGAGATHVIRRGLVGIAKKTTNTWDDTIVATVRGPLVLALTMGFTLALLPYLRLYPPARAFLHQLVRGALLGDFFWILARLIEAGAIIGRRRGVVSGASAQSLIPLATRVGKVVVLAIALVAFLSELGYPVTSLIAGLGLGGLAFALAAQKTIENLFGAFSIGADQPFRQGDFIRVDDLLGTVEIIGLRSTKVRTLDRTLVTMPNGWLAEKRLETFAARDRIRLNCTLGLDYEATAEQIRKVLADIEARLRAHPKIWPDTITVRFTELSQAFLKIEVMCWFSTSNFDEFQAIRQEVLLDFMGIVENAGAAFAYPSRTMRLISEIEGRPEAAPDAPA